MSIFVLIGPGNDFEGFFDDTIHSAVPAGAVEISAVDRDTWAVAGPDGYRPGAAREDGTRTIVAYTPPPPPLAPLQARLCANVDAQAEAQRGLYITDGSGQAMVYLQKQTQAAQALAGLAATPAMTAAQGAAAFALLAAEVGITVDPSTKTPASDVFGVARAVAITVAVWLPIAAAIEGMRLRTKAAIMAAATADAAQAAFATVAWPAAPTG